MTERIRVMVVEDHAVVRQGLIALLSSAPDIEVIAWAGDGWTAVELYHRYRPDITLMDLRLPTMGGVEKIKAIRGDDSK
jgi:YesN/AraC family two-component response regulator